MVSSFHQFCTTCEKQIALPNNAHLYCSESCRRRDAQHSHSSGSSSPTSSAVGSGASTSSSTGTSAQATLSSTPLTEYEAFLGRPLISRRNPSSAFASMIQHEGKIAMDATEWKPDGKSTDVSTPHSGGSTAPIHVAEHDTTAHDEDGNAASPATGQAPPRARSDAYLYLAQFHRSTDSFAQMTASSSARRVASRRSTIAATSKMSFDQAFAMSSSSDGSSISISNSSSGYSSSSSSSSSDEDYDEASVGLTGPRKMSGDTLVPSIRVSSVDDINAVDAGSDNVKDFTDITYPKKALSTIDMTNINAGGLGKLLASKPGKQANVARFRPMQW